MLKAQSLLLFLGMRKTVKINRPQVKACGGKRGKGCGSSWAGSTKLQTKIRIAA